ncbi:MAG: esterase/lipase family protein [Gammaproteobacteria bacterium]
MHVVLIHGMGRTPGSMLRLRRRLKRAGHVPHLFAYSPTFETLDHAVARLARLIEHRIGGDRYALIGHSLGTVLIRCVLARVPAPPAACFFLAPPMLACKAARHFSRFRLYRWLTGEMGSLLADDAFMHGLPIPQGVLRVYVGTRGPRADWLPFGMEENDGVLSVAEASGDCASAVVKVHALHTFIMHAEPVYADILTTLAELETAKMA